MKKILLIIISLFLLTASFLAGCSNNKYTIGILGDFEGMGKTNALGSQTSALHAIEDMGLDWEILLVQYDSETLTADIEEQKIDVLIGPSLSNELIHVYAELHNMNIPVFVGSATSNFINDRRDYFYRLALSNKHYGQLIAEDLMSHNYDAILFIYDTKNESFTLESVDTISSNLTDVKFRLFSADDNYKLPSDISEYSTVYIVASPEKTGSIVQKLRASNYNNQVYFGPWSSNPNVVNYLDGLTENIKIHSMNYSDKTYYNNYRKRFIEEAGIDLPASGFFTYETINLLNKMSQEIDITDGNEINNYLSTNPMYEGYFIDTLIDDDGNGHGRIYTLEIVDGMMNQR